MRQFSKQCLKSFAIVGIALGVFAGPSLAEADPDTAIKYRKNVMKAVGGHTQAAAAILKGEIDAPSALAPHARSLALTAETALAAFQQNTDGQGVEKTTATDKIWSDWTGYEKAMQDFVEASAAFAEAAEAGTATGKNLQQLGGTCKSCHDKFREK